MASRGSITISFDPEQWTNKVFKFPIIFYCVMITGYMIPMSFVFDVWSGSKLERAIGMIALLAGLYFLMIIYAIICGGIIGTMFDSKMEALIAGAIGSGFGYLISSAILFIIHGMIVVDFDNAADFFSDNISYVMASGTLGGASAFCSRYALDLKHEWELTDEGMSYAEQMLQTESSTTIQDMPASRVITGPSSAPPMPSNLYPDGEYKDALQRNKWGPK